MAQTTSVKTVRKHYLKYYFFLLFPVAIIWAAVAIFFTYRWYNNSPDKYEDLVSRRNALVNTYNRNNEKYQKAREAIDSSPIDIDQKEQYSNLSKMIDDNLDNLKALKEIDHQLDSLKLEGNQKSYVKKVIELDETEFDVNIKTQELLSREELVNQYRVSIKAIDDCFSSIDLASNDNLAISAQIDACIPRIQKVQQDVTTYEDKTGIDLLETKQYLNILREYWTKSSTFYSNLAQNKSKEATDMQADIQNLSNQASTGRAASDAEIFNKLVAQIQQDIEGQYTEIESLKKEVRQLSESQDK